MAHALLRAVFALMRMPGGYINAPMNPAPTAGEGQSLLRFETVSLHFDEVVALDSVSFELFAGETRVVLGAAGSGKTTLLKTAIGLLRPDSGRVYLFGQEITHFKTWLKPSIKFE